MIQLAIFSPIPALRAGLRALVTGDPELCVAVSAAGLAEPGDLPAEVRVLIATPGGVDLAEASLPHEMALLLVAEASAGDTAQQVRALAGLELHAWGVISPEATAEALQAAVRALAEGLSVISPEVIAPILAAADAASAAAAAAANTGTFGGHLLGGEVDETPVVDRLTEREIEVLGLIAQGMTNKQIAHALQISEHTVKFHVSSIYSKLGAANRTEAVRKGARRGWVPL